jgi:hypothetical protein
MQAKEEKISSEVDLLRNLTLATAESLIQKHPKVADWDELQYKDNLKIIQIYLLDQIKDLDLSINDSRLYLTYIINNGIAEA